MERCGLGWASVGIVTGLPAETPRSRAVVSPPDATDCGAARVLRDGGRAGLEPEGRRPPAMMLRHGLEKAARVFWRCRRAEFADHTRRTLRPGAGEFQATDPGLAQKVAPKNSSRRAVRCSPARLEVSARWAQQRSTWAVAGDADALSAPSVMVRTAPRRRRLRTRRRFRRLIGWSRRARRVSMPAWRTAQLQSGDCVCTAEQELAAVDQGLAPPRRPQGGAAAGRRATSLGCAGGRSRRRAITVSRSPSRWVTERLPSRLGRPTSTA
jgi:hypothetical protein